MPESGRSDQTTLRAEVEHLRRNAERRTGGRDFPVAARWDDSTGHLQYLYRNHQLICDDHNVSVVLEAFDQAGADRPASVSDGPLGLKVLDLGDRDAADTADTLADALGDDDMVTPNHVLDAQGYVKLCPATEPLPHGGPVAELDEPRGSGQASLAVVDTGYSADVARASAYGRLLAVESISEPDDEVFDDEGRIVPYGGHGTAATARLLSVSGVNAATVRVRDCLVGGAVDELTITEDLESVMTAGVDIISIQAGLYTRAGRSPKAFNAFRRRVLSKYPNTVLVAAAGNQGTDRPFWPAAYDWVTAVGALSHGGDSRTGWTNFGYWVDVYASGENVTVPFPNGIYEYLGGFSAEFTGGHALWSGTSFAAPVVAGLIARRMIERNVDAPTARDIVLNEAAIAALPTTGPRLIV